jgi:small subunit ribosomal protein S16
MSLCFPAASLPVRPGPLRIRLARFGLRNSPIYTIHLVEASRRRNARPIEILGKYEPIPDKIDGMKHCQLNVTRIKYWLSQGAEPTDRISWLLGKAGILPSIPRGPSFANTSQSTTDKNT